MRCLETVRNEERLAEALELCNYPNFFQPQCKVDTGCQALVSLTILVTFSKILTHHFLTFIFLEKTPLFAKFINGSVFLYAEEK